MSDRRLLTPIILDALNRPIPRPVTHPDPTPVCDWTEKPELCPDPVLLTIGEIATALRVSEKTVRRRVGDGTIRKVPMGGRTVRISSDELARLAAGEQPKAPGNDVDIPK